MKDILKNIALTVAYLFVAAVIASIITGCATTQNSLLETRISALETQVNDMTKSYNENIKTSNENVEILNAGIKAIKSLAEIAKNQDQRIETLEKQANETHF